jgi:PAS domain S-box-containing protein
MVSFRPSRLSFRAKISLYGAVVGIISLGLAAAIFLVNEEIQFRSTFAARAYTEADIVRTACASAVVFQDPDFAAKSLAGLAGSDGVRAAGVYLADRTILAAYFRPGVNERLPETLPNEDQVYFDSCLATTLPILFDSNHVGWIYVCSEFPNNGPRLRQHALIALGVMLLSLLISLLIASFLQNPITGPVRELQAAAQAMAGGRDTTVRARKLADDELGDLTDSVNEMFNRVVDRERALRESQEQFAGLLDRLGEAVFRLGVPSGICEYCSPAAREVFGYSAAEFLARPRILEDIVHPEYREFLTTELSHLESGHCTPVWEYQILDPRGKVRWIYQTNSATRDDQGHIVALESCCTDITLRREASEEKRRLQAELAQAHKLEALGNLAGGIAHDFNNLLGAIIGYNDLAVTELPPSHPARDSLAHIAMATERATALTKQILSFSRRGETGKDPIDMGRLTNDAMAMMRATLPATIRFQTDISSNPCVISANPNELHRVIMNLCTNASHAMNGSGGELNVAMKPVVLLPGDRRLGPDMKHGPYAELSISDTGHGIPEEIQGRIFEPFFTTKISGEGTGMGLSVAYGIIMEHRGTIDVQSRSGQGTTFRILLPLVREKIKKAEVLVEEERIESGRVLFIDDEELLTQLASRALSAKGYQVDVFNDPRQAVAAFRNQPDAYDVVFTDLTMPVMTGLEVAREVLADRPQIPVVLCSGFAQESTRTAARELGIHAIATKPLNVLQIDQLVQAALRKQPLPEDLA